MAVEKLPLAEDILHRFRLLSGVRAFPRSAICSSSSIISAWIGNAPTSIPAIVETKESSPAAALLHVQRVWIMIFASRISFENVDIHSDT
ncbi:MAG: hypothetical protein R2881_08340 [Eubacteriales bacterium]